MKVLSAKEIIPGMVYDSEPASTDRMSDASNVPPPKS